MAKRQLSDEQRREAAETGEADRLETGEEAERFDASGRKLYPWEADPEPQEAAAQVEESDEERVAQERQQRRDAANEQRAAGTEGTEPTATTQTS